MRCRWLTVCAVLLLSLVSACKILEVPYVSVDGSGATAGVGGSLLGFHSGGDTWHAPSGGSDSSGSGASSGFGGELVAPELVVGADLPIKGIGVTDHYIYWTTEGVIDGETGESTYPGGLFRMPESGGLIEAAAATIEGPTRMEMTDTAAYFWAASPTVAYLGFVQLALGSTIYSPVHVGASPPALFFAFEDRAYVSHDLGPDSGVFEHVVGFQPRRVVWGMPKDIAADATHVYYATSEAELFRAPLDDPTSTELIATGITQDFALWQDQVLVIRGGTLEGMPKSGGELTQKLILEAGGAFQELRVAGDRYFVSRPGNYDLIDVHTGLVSRGDCEWVWSLHDEDVWLGLPDRFYTTTGTFIQRKSVD